MEEIFMIKTFQTRYNELIKQTTGKSDNYTAGCLLDYHYYSNQYNIVAADLSKQEILDSDPRAIQKVQLTYSISNNVNAQILTILEKEKQTS